MKNERKKKLFRNRILQLDCNFTPSSDFQSSGRDANTLGLGSDNHNRTTDIIYLISVVSDNFMKKSKRARFSEFSKETKEQILNRDKGCIFCRSKTGLTYAHYISRAKGGIGSVKNGVMLCLDCHFKTDHTVERQDRLNYIKSYLIGHYGELWNENELYYKNRT